MLHKKAIIIAVLTLSSKTKLLSVEKLPNPYTYLLPKPCPKGHALQPKLCQMVNHKLLAKEAFSKILRILCKLNAPNLLHRLHIATQLCFFTSTNNYFSQSSTFLCFRSWHNYIPIIYEYILHIWMVICSWPNSFCFMLILISLLHILQ